MKKVLKFLLILVVLLGIVITTLTFYNTIIKNNYSVIEDSTE